MFLKNCAYCGNPFEAKAQTAMYCSNSHRVLAGRKNLKLRATSNEQPAINNEQPENPLIKPTVFPQPIQQPPKETVPKLDALGAFMVRTVERERDKLEKEFNELKSKYENLQQEKTALEKELDNTSRELKEKPNGLSGFFQTNPDITKTAIEMGMPLLAGTAEKLVNWITEQQQTKQLAGAAPEQNTNPIWMWLVAQPKEIQENFVMLLEKLDATGRAKDYLESWNRQLMRVVPKTNTR